MPPRRSSMKRPASIDADVQAQQHSVIPGQKVWIPDPDKKKCWVLTTVAGSFTYGTATVTTEQGIELDVDINSILDYDSTHDLMLSDISDMNDLHEGPLLALLERRFRSKRIHTWCSDVLVALNPFQAVDISPEVEGSKPPSIEAVARAVVEELQAQLKQQSILVSGESGAGKTFAARAVIRELVGMSLLNRRSEARRRASLQSLPDDARVLSQYYERKLEQASPLLEAFGNASTEMNHNSSRFGRWTRIIYDNQGLFIEGAAVEEFLLEKGRVTTIGANERNYHIFYQLLAGKSASQRSLFQLKSDAKQYSWLAKGKTQSEGIDDASGFAATQKAMEEIGIADERVKETFGLLAGLLALGNVEPAEDADDESKSVIADSADLGAAAALLGLDADMLKHCITFRTITVRGETQHIPLVETQARDARDACAKEIYCRIFHWIVSQLNAALAFKGGTTVRSSSATEGRDESRDELTIGILDLYGFEVMVRNSLEQLMINFANEVLQQQFNEKVLLSEVALYEDAGIEVTAGIENCLLDDQVTIDLIQAPPYGLMPLLDEQGKLGKQGSDKNFAAAAKKAHNKHPSFRETRFKSDGFIIKHYAGEVIYDSLGFVAKNEDMLRGDLSTMLHESTIPFIANAFQTVDATDHATKKALRKTTTLKFREQMGELMDVLRRSTPWYIRCVRPNQKHDPEMFDFPYVAKQLRYFGVLEIIKIRRLGWPERLIFREFTERFRVLDPEFVALAPPPEDSLAATLRIIETLPFASEMATIGKERIFGKEHFLKQCALILEKRHSEYARRMQKLTWRFLTRTRYLSDCATATIIASGVRKLIAKKRSRSRLRAAVLVSGLARINISKRIVKQLAAVKRTKEDEARRLEEARILREEMLRKAEEERVEQEQRLQEQSAAATKLQCRSRIKAAKAAKARNLEEKKAEGKRIAEKQRADATTRISSHVRAFLERQCVRFIRHMSFPFRTFLRGNEFVVTVSIVAKLRDGFDKMMKIMKAKRHYLVVTSHCRLLWFDESDHEVYELVKEVAFTSPMTTVQLPKGAENSSRFQICRKSKSTLTYCLLSGGEGQRLIDVFRLVNDPRPELQLHFMKIAADFNLGNGVKNMPVEKAGFLRKLAINSRKTLSAPSLFIMQGGNIRLYAGTTSSQLRFEFPLINSLAELEPCSHKVIPCGFKLAVELKGESAVKADTAPLAAHALVAMASTVAERNDWMAEIAATMAVPDYAGESYRRRILRGRLNFEPRPLEATYKSPYIDASGLKEMQKLSTEEDRKAEPSAFHSDGGGGGGGGRLSSGIIDTTSLSIEGCAEIRAASQRKISSASVMQLRQEASRDTFQDDDE